MSVSNRNGHAPASSGLLILEILPHGEGSLDGRHGTLDAHVARIYDQIVVDGVFPVGAEIFTVEGIPIRFCLVNIALRCLKVDILAPHDVANLDLPEGSDTNTEGLFRGQYKLASSAHYDRIALLTNGTDDLAKVAEIFIRPNVAGPEQGINPGVP